MDKQEMIEEMADIVFNSRYKNDYISPLKSANELYNAGYRKTPKEDRIAQLEQENEYLKKGSSGLLESIRHASAQVIKLFADELLKVAHNSNGTIRECDVNDILKRYSVFRGVEE